jgi:tetratricopeptide (TPR) repeat protein
MTDQPLCFVLMPFGTKKDPSGGPDIDFDRIYEAAIRPGIEAAGMEPIRADEERTGGIIHQAMFERLLLCDYAVADLTTANANVFYELGVRHAARPSTTLAIFASHQRPAFDVNYLRALPYEMAEGNRFGPEQAVRLRDSLAERLRQLRSVAHEQSSPDSPIFQLLTDYKAPDIARLKTDVFRDRVQYAAGMKRKLADARARNDADALAALEQSLAESKGGLGDTEAGVLVDLFLSYRAVQAWDLMIQLYERLPAVLRRSVTVREQLAFALNRARRRREAIEILEDVVKEQGPSSETNGLMGRVYKDLWAEASEAGSAQAAGFLDRAIASYVRGFEADWRDAYPGINAATLLDIKGSEKSLKQKSDILPVVRFAVAQRLKSPSADYWDHATMLEIAVLDQDEEAAREHLGAALAAVRESWEPLTTANNLALIRDARRKRGVLEPWLDEVIEQLQNPGRVF